MQITARPGAAGACSALLERGFRPFFLGAGAFAVLHVLFWAAALVGWVPAPAWLTPIRWHAHEMLFGFVPAAIAGFLLTAVPVWTRTRPVSGTPLALLVALWLAGRLALACAGWLPALVLAPIDLAFLPALALAVGGPLLRGAPRNRGFLAVLAGLFAANACLHLAALGHPSLAAPALRVAVHGVALLVVVLGGRLTPSFTANALRLRGAPHGVRVDPTCERLAVPGVLAVLAAEIVAPHGAVAGAAAFFAAGVLAARMRGWQTARVLDDPLLWSLHLGHAWLAVGYGCLAVSGLLGALPETSALHALTAGAFGAMILAVMSRVPLGHTGRPWVALPGMPLAYALVSVGALLRVAISGVPPGATLALTVASGALWATGFLLFVIVYAPVLIRPRVDGRPG